MIYVKIVEYVKDEKGFMTDKLQEVKIENLTHTGIGIALHDCRELTDRLEDRHGQT